MVDVDVIPLIPCIDAGLFIHTRMVGIDVGFVETAPCGDAITYRHTPTSVHLFAFVRGSVLQAFDVEVLGIDFNAFAFYLATDEIRIATGLNHGFTLAITYMTCYICGFITIAVTFTVVTA